METRIVCTEIWRNPDFRKLDHASKIIILFLLSNDKIPVLPVYQIPLDEICFYCGVTDKKLNEVLQIINKFGIYYVDEFFIIEDKFTRAKYTGGKTENKRLRLHQVLPDAIKELLDYEGNIGQSLGNHCPTIGHINHKSENINQKSEIKNQKTKTEFSSFDDLTDEVCQEIANEYQATLQEVFDTKMDMEVWMGKSNKNKYKNYKLALMTWVRKNKNVSSSNNFKKRGGYIDITE